MSPLLGHGDSILYDLASSPLANLLNANVASTLNAENRNEVARRALVQVMAIRAWQLQHDGQFPARLEDIVPNELPSLPVNPYSGKPFGYITYAQANPSALQMVFLSSGMGDCATLPKETRLLSSVGPNRLDVLRVTASPGTFLDDIVFPIPPLGKPTTR